MSDFEERADEAVEELRAFIDTEQQTVKGNHDFHNKLLSWAAIFNRLYELCPDGSDLEKLNFEVVDEISEITAVVDEGALQGLRIEKEDAALLGKLENDVQHREWRAVKHDIDKAKALEKEAIRLHKDEIKVLHKKFIGIMRMMKKKLKPALEHLTAENKKKDFERQEEYYFLQMYKFTRAYERIFRHLWKKERILLRG